MLTTRQIELKTLLVAEQVERRQLAEDHLVEVKSDWPGPDSKVARKIAGHANSACPEGILWVIGLNEKGAEVPGARPHEFSTWWAQVKKFFDGHPPACRELVVSYKGVSVMALAFETDRAPYVVRTEANSGPIQREVPWRDGQETRSATRAELIQIAEPPTRYPEIEIVKASLTLEPSPQTQPETWEEEFAQRLGARVRLFSIDDSEAPSPIVPAPTLFNGATIAIDLYLSPSFDARQVVFPFHHCSAIILLAGRRLDYETLSLTPSQRPILRDYSTSKQLQPPPQSFENRSTRHEFILVQAGLAHIRIRLTTPEFSSAEAANQARVTLRLHAVRAPRPHEVEIHMERSNPDLLTFCYQPQDPSRLLVRSAYR